MLRLLPYYECGDRLLIGVCYSNRHSTGASSLQKDKSHLAAVVPAGCSALASPGLQADEYAALSILQLLFLSVFPSCFLAILAHLLSHTDGDFFLF